jgi:hypothetical protein
LLFNEGEIVTVENSTCLFIKSIGSTSLHTTLDVHIKHLIQLLLLQVQKKVDALDMGNQTYNNSQ